MIVELFKILPHSPPVGVSVLRQDSLGRNISLFLVSKCDFKFYLDLDLDLDLDVLGLDLVVFFPTKTNNDE